MTRISRREVNKTLFAATAGLMVKPHEPWTAGLFELADSDSTKANDGERNDHILWVTRPASKWEEAFPCGNGIVGAMMYGNIGKDLILLNHQGFYLPWHHRSPQPVAEHLAKIRELLLQRKYGEADDFYKKVMSSHGYVQGVGHDVDPFQPVFDLRIENMNAIGVNTPQDYVYALNLTSGESVVKYRQSDVEYERTLFVSRADDLVALNLTASQVGRLNYKIALVPHPLSETLANEEASWAKGGGKVPFRALPFEPIHVPMDTLQTTHEVRENRVEWLTFVGRHSDGSEFGGVSKLIIRNAENVQIREGNIEINGADEIQVLTKLFIQEKAETAILELKQALLALPDDYRTLLDRSVSLHAELFNRATVRLNSSDVRSNNELLSVASQRREVPTELIQRMYEYGRYMLIASSGGKFPATEQGLWNGSYWLLFDGCYQLDEDLEMCYWPALPGNLPETTMPYFDYFEGLADSWRWNAKNILGCRGFYASGTSTTNGRISYSDAVWPSGAGWVGQLFYDYYLFTQDLDFLKSRAVPFLKEVALFYEDFLIKDSSGKLMFIPSYSPEQPGRILHINPTMDVTICKEVLRNLCSACELLGIESEGRERWESLGKALPEYAINRDGALAEWIHEDFRDNYNHRHLSHLYGVSPGQEITAEGDPRLYRAARIALDKRYATNKDDRPGWGLAHYANAYARLGDGNMALRCLEELFQNSYPWQSLLLRLYSGWELFLADAHFGFTSAVQEMLLFSTPGMVKLLPACPEKWERGSVKGMSCRGGIQVGMQWDTPGRWLTATLLSKMPQQVCVKFPSIPATVASSNKNVTVETSPRGDAYRLIKLPATTEVTLTIRF
jgi:alpha-L-fucosidase 2